MGALGRMRIEVRPHTWKSPSQRVPVPEFLESDAQIEYLLFFEDLLDGQVPFIQRTGIWRQAGFFNERFQGLFGDASGQSVDGP